MPNLAGVFCPRSPSGTLEPTLSRLADILSVRGVSFHCCRWEDDRFGAVNLLKPEIDDAEQPARLPGGELLFLDGEIYNIAALASESYPPVRSGGPAAQCLELYARDPTETARRLNGSFNLAFYDPAHQVLQLVSDRLGSRPLYYQEHRGTLYFALEQKAILAARDSEPRFDALAVFQLAAFGHQLGDRTIFDGISVLPPGSILTVTPQGSRITSYWRPMYRTSPGTGVEASRELAHRFVAATRRRIANRRAPLGIFLSGGLDSRFAAGALAATGAPVTAFTFGSESSRDVQFARQIAHALHFPHRTFEDVRCDFAATLPRVVWRTEGTLPFLDCLSIDVHRYIYRDARVIFNGHLGDALTGAHLLPELFWLRRRDLAGHILRKRSLISKERLQRLCVPHQFESLYAGMHAAVEQGLGRFDEERPALLFNLWDLDVRQRRYTQSTPAVDRYLLEQISPFFDNEVVEHCLGLPASELFGQRCYLGAILDAFPSISRVPWTRTGHIIEHNHALRMLRLGSQSVLGKAWRTVQMHAGVSEPTPSFSLRSAGLRAVIRDYLASDLFPSQVFDRKAVAAVVTSHFDGGDRNLEEVGVLLTLASAAQVLAGNLRTVPTEVQPDLTIHGAMPRAASSSASVPPS